MKASDFETIKTIGKSDVGVIVKVRHKKSGHFFAVKQILSHKFAQKKSNLIITEFDNIQKYYSPYLVNDFGFYQDDLYVFLFCFLYIIIYN
jgi:serine/threonine protein kinase